MVIKRKLKKKPIIYGIIVAGFVTIQILVSLKIVNSYYLQVLMLAEINVIMVVSLNLINGFTGLFSLGHATFMGIGAYISAIITTILWQTSTWSEPFQSIIFLVALLVGGLVAGFIGLLIGLPSFKLKGDYLAIVTLAFGEVVKVVIRLTNFVGGPRGITNIPKYSNFFWISLLMVISIFVIRNYIYSHHGRSCVATRENEIAAQCMGINTNRFKLVVMVTATFFAGVAGGLLAHLMMYIEPNLFDLPNSIDYLVFLYAGGMGSISGSIVSALSLSILPEMLRFLDDWRLVIYPLLLIIIMLRRPNGLLGGKEIFFLKKGRDEYLKPEISIINFSKKKDIHGKKVQ